MTSGCPGTRHTAASRNVFDTRLERPCLTHRDARRVNADSMTPAYHRVDGLTRVGPAWQAQPVLGAQQIEDVVAFLLTLRD